MYIVIFYIKCVCVRALETGRKRAFGKLFWSVSQWVQTNFIFHRQCLSCNFKGPKNKRPIWLKRTETMFIRIVFKVVLWQVRTIPLWYLPFDLHWSGTKNTSQTNKANVHCDTSWTGTGYLLEHLGHSPPPYLVLCRVCA